VIDTSPVHSTSQASQAHIDQLERQESDTLQQGHPQQEDMEEKASLASHSNASVASLKSKSSRVSVASSKSSVHSRESIASSSSSKSSRTSIPNFQSSTSHSLGKVDSSEFVAVSDNSLTQRGSAMLNKDDSVEPETADADTQYNYEDDNFEEPEEVDSEEVEESKQQPAVERLEDTDPELRKNELCDSDPNKELDAENPTHQTEQQSNTIGTASALTKDTKPSDGADGTEYDYEDDKFEETNPEETDEPKQQSNELPEDTNPVTPPSPSESAEGSKETAREISAESRVEKENADSNNDTETQDDTTDSYDAEVKVPSRQSSGDDTNAEDLVNPENDKEAPTIEELHASKAGSAEIKEEVEDGGVSDQNQTSVISGDTQEAQIIDQADKEQLQQGILLSSSRRKSTGLSVSFEAASESVNGSKQQERVRGEQQPTKDLSASSTIEEAQKMLQKSQSTASLGSLLNEKESTPVESELDLSGSEDEDIPDLERKISDLIDGDGSQTGDKTESQENAEAVEDEKQYVDGAGSEDQVDSQKAAIPQLVSESEKKTDEAEEISELQEGTETAMVPGSEKGMAENADDAETVVLENEKGQPGEEIKSEDQDRIPASSQTEIAKEVANQDATIANQGFATNSQTETAQHVAEAPDQETAVDIPSTNSQTETAREAEPSKEDSTNREATNAEGETKGEPGLVSVPAESADINDIGSVKSSLSSSSKSSLTSVSSQGSQRS
jgi:hypothetical protein